MMKIQLSPFFRDNILSLIIYALIGVACSLTVITNARGEVHEGYQITQIAAEPYKQIIQRTGKVDFARVVNLSFKTAGFLTQLNVDEGEIFKKNQLLAALDTAELLAEKNATYARLLQAKRNVERIKTLLQKNLSSQQALDDALTAIDTTRSVYRVAYYNLEKAQILAPFDGVVVRRNTDLGELQSPGAGALQVAALANNLIASVALTGEEISLVHLGQKVKVHLAYLGLVEGEISKIPAIANSRNHLFTIEVALSETNSIKPLIVGQLARIHIATQSQKFVYRLPIAALNAVNEQDEALITIENNNQPVQQAFPIYKMDNDFIYLMAQPNAAALNVITQGWDKLPLISTEQ